MTIFIDFKSRSGIEIAMKIEQAKKVVLNLLTYPSAHSAKYTLRNPPKAIPC